MTFEDASCEQNNDAYILLQDNEDQKYRDGETAFVCTTPKVVELVAYFEDGRLLSDEGIVTWQGATVDNSESHKATFLRADASSGLSDAIEVTASVGITSLTIKLISAKASYSELEGQKYGFDDNDEREAYPYPSHRATEPWGVVWKSIKLGDTDGMNYSLEPSIAASTGRMKFYGGTVSVSPTVANVQGTVNITGNSIGDSEIYINGGGGCRARTAVYNGRIMTLGLILVDAPDRQNEYIIDDNIRNTIQQELQNVYKKAIVQWEVRNLGRETIAYDLNGDGLLMTARNNLYSDEQNYILDNSTLANGCDRYLFFTDKSDLNDIGGQNEIGNTRGGFIRVDGLVGSAMLPPNMIGHELGHSFSLLHPFQEFAWSGKDEDNIMQYRTGNEFRIGEILRKFQWDTIQDN